ncbi:PREDICTED: MADS-box protein JOINTLESS-like [Erythranthe guttata]|uniref:MADS-box protein JOINTLESS-like n=1 Tax=Erythranthe guttata TaxID=4155 RepID=UPI00064E135F|nr:PREDICTED: MADS-box protein JOINTLESS-like [Erythranthe guttata]|eukprot:XP_012854196.1 PREDICTED: MADS-box protein JOINTLESS-like [Erythranthe guttata]
MAREKMKIKKIANGAARQVTLTKRRKGLFKKAEELSILCDAEIGLLIISSSSITPIHFFTYATTSMKDIIERYKLHSKNLDELEQPSELQLVRDSNFSEINKEVAERSHQLRRMREEELQGLSIDELHRLEQSMEAGLRRIMEKKEEKIMREINQLQEKMMQLMEGNKLLRREVMDIITNGSGDEEVSNDVLCQLCL